MNNIILLIEDSVEIRENTTELLELAGYNVVSASNGIEGLSQARKTKPDLIFCDIMMPELDGYGVLRALQNIPELNGTPFVFLTAKSERTDFRAGMDLGADDYLTKPFTGDDLLRVASARIRKGQQQKTNQEAYFEGHDVFKENVHPTEMLEMLSTNRTTKKLKGKTSIYMEGDSAVHLCFVLSGKVKIYKTNETGREYLTEIVKEGGFFGYTALFNDHIHQQSAETIENSEIAFIPRQDFFNLLYTNKELSLKFLKFLSGSLAGSEEKLLHLAYNSARKKVAEAILFIYHQYHEKESPEFSFPANRENIASIAGIAPESVSRNLSDFRDEKLIVTDNGNMRITDFKKLAQLRS